MIIIHKILIVCMKNVLLYIHEHFIVKNTEILSIVYHSVYFKNIKKSLILFIYKFTFIIFI